MDIGNWPGQEDTYHVGAMGALPQAKLQCPMGGCRFKGTLSEMNQHWKKYPKHNLR